MHAGGQHQRGFTDCFRAMNGAFPVIACSPDLHIEVFGAITGCGYLIGRRGVGFQLACFIPPQFFGGQPAHALNKAALNLAQINRRVQRPADVVQDIDGQDSIFPR